MGPRDENLEGATTPGLMTMKLYSVIPKAQELETSPSV